MIDLILDVSQLCALEKLKGQTAIQGWLEHIDGGQCAQCSEAGGKFDGKKSRNWKIAFSSLIAFSITNFLVPDLFIPYFLEFQ